MNKKAQSEVIQGIVWFCFVMAIIYGFVWYLPHFAVGWDTGVMTGKLIGYDTNLFGTKSVFILEPRSVFNGNGGMSQSQITLCSDYDDEEIHKLIQEYLNQDVTIEYMERRVGYYPYRYCHESPITNIKLLNQTK